MELKHQPNNTNALPNTYGATINILQKPRGHSHQIDQTVPLLSRAGFDSTMGKMSSRRRTSPNNVVGCWKGETASWGGMEKREDAVAEDGAYGDETLDQRDKFPLLSLCNWRKVAYLRN